MKIAIIGTAHPLRGGLAAFNERMAHELISLGHDVQIYTFKVQYPGFLFPGKTQYTTQPKPTDLSIDVCIHSYSPLNWWSVGKKIRKENFDLIIVKFWIPFMGPCFGTILHFATKNTSSKTLCILDNVIPHEKRPGDHIFTKYFLSKVNYFVAMSKSVLQDLRLFEQSKPAILKAHPLYDHYGYTIPQHEAKSKLGLNQRPVLLFFGFIREYKGLDLLLESLHILKSQGVDYQCLVAGEFYSNEAFYKDLAHKLGVDDLVHWSNDFIPDDLVHLYFSAADLVVQPYKTATQSGVTQIAYHFEKPMIVTDVGGLAELIPNNQVGYVVQPSAPALADAIKRFFQDPEIGARFSKNLAVAKQNFSWRSFCVSFLEMCSQDFQA
ncbi:MAG: glycosyltransferase [Saprospiraceae bacterium]|nr:glycosyltransferase [Saprospiraceae bacterium]